jgi:hypothetical protein
VRCKVGNQCRNGSCQRLAGAPGNWHAESGPDLELLGRGKDNYAAGREVGEQVMEALPDIPAIARATRWPVAAAGSPGPRPPPQVWLSAMRRARAGHPALRGMPLRHPESITADLPAAQDEQLAAVARELWPDDEYTAIIAEQRG